MSLSASLSSYIDIPLMTSLYRSPSLVTRITGMYASGRPCASWVRRSSSGPQTIPRVLPTLSLQGKVSSNNFFLGKKHLVIQVTGLPRDWSCSGTWEPVLSCVYAIVSILSRLLQIVGPLKLCKRGCTSITLLDLKQSEAQKAAEELIEFAGTCSQ